MKNVLWLCLSLVLVFMSCGSDEEDVSRVPYVEKSVNASSKDVVSENLIGTWNMISYSNGWNREEYEKGEIVVVFTDKGKMIVDNKRDGFNPIGTGTYTYYITTIEGTSVDSDDSWEAIVISEQGYCYKFIDEQLYLWMESVFDGPNYVLQKL